jgi:hypothetical protein
MLTVLPYLGKVQERFTSSAKEKDGFNLKTTLIYPFIAEVIRLIRGSDIRNSKSKTTCHVLA